MSAKPPSREQISLAQEFVLETMLKPWRAGAQGPQAYDCWGLARATQMRLARRDLPMINADPADLRAVIRLIATHPIQLDWTEQPTPRHLDVVTMAHHKHASHIGVFLALDGGGILHATEQFDRKGDSAPAKPGVSFDTIHQLRFKGFMGLHFMRHRDDLA